MSYISYNEIGAKCMKRAANRRMIRDAAINASETANRESMVPAKLVAIGLVIAFAAIVGATMGVVA